MSEGWDLPSTVCVSQRMPKEAFYKHLQLNAATKDEFVRGIEGLRVVAAIKEATCGIPATKGVQEISVMEVMLKGTEVPERALDAIAVAVPRKVLFVCRSEDRVRLAVRRDRLYVGEWLPEDGLSLSLAGADLGAVWDALCAQAIFGDTNGTDIDSRISRKRRMAALYAEIRQLEKKHAREVQPAKRNALFKQLRASRAELVQLKE